MLEFLQDYAGYVSIFLLLFLMVLSVPVFVAMGLAAFAAALLNEAPFHAFKTFVNVTWQSASIRSASAVATKRPSPRRATSSRKTRSRASCPARAARPATSKPKFARSRRGSTA